MAIWRAAWKAHKRAQKDVDAKWTKEHGKRHKLVRKVVITHAAVADTTVFEDLLD